MSKRAIHVAGQEVSAGEVKRAALELTEMPDGLIVRIPLLLINGGRPGPRLYLGAAIHGDEANGVEILWNVLRNINPEKLNGSIICVPVQNPLAFHNDHRISIGHYLKSPLDQAPIDPWSIFPGDSDGNFAQRLAHQLYELIRSCDYAIDCHTPTRGGRYPPIAILPHYSIGESAERSFDLAKAFGSPYVIRPNTGFYISDGILCVEAAKSGIPSFTFELGEGGRLEAEMIAEGARCIRNALRHLKMIEGDLETPEQTVIMSDFVGMRAKRGGLLHTEVALGANVRRGDVLARILDIYGDEIERITAPQPGIFIRSTTLSTVTTGERVATLGIPV